MKTATWLALAGMALMASAGAASAGDPVKLSDAQMEGADRRGRRVSYCRRAHTRRSAV